MDVDLRLTVAGLSVSAVSLQTLAEVRADDVPTASVNITAVIPGQTLVYIWVDTPIINNQMQSYFSILQILLVLLIVFLFSSF